MTITILNLGETLPGQVTMHSRPEGVTFTGCQADDETVYVSNIAIPALIAALQEHLEGVQGEEGHGWGV
jgi:hypothetical protein